MSYPYYIYRREPNVAPERVLGGLIYFLYVLTQWIALYFVWHL